jgi:hypothetical protein
MNRGKFDTVGKNEGLRGNWSLGARVAITAILLFHVSATWFGAWDDQPSSPLQRWLGGGFRWYHGLIDQGYSYRYYSDGSPPTPVVIALIHYPDGRTEQVRLPDRKTRPRMLYQRELALAHALQVDMEQARQATQDPSQSMLARSYARHLSKTHPGARSVTLSIAAHRSPDPDRVLEELRRTRKTPDLDADEFFAVPERIGEFPCDAS